MRILIVEDTPDLLRLFARILRSQGFEVCEASDGQSALACLSHFRPDLILTDMMMPSLDGIGLLAQLRRMPELVAVPVVLMSAVTTPEAESKALHAGAVDFLAKPFDADTLIGCLNAHASIEGMPTLS